MFDGLTSLLVVVILPLGFSITISMTAMETLACITDGVCTAFTVNIGAETGPWLGTLMDQQICRTDESKMRRLPTRQVLVCSHCLQGQIPQPVKLLQYLILLLRSLGPIVLETIGN